MLSQTIKIAIPLLLAVFCLSVASAVYSADPDYSAYNGLDSYNWQFDASSSTVTVSSIQINSWDGYVTGCDTTGPLSSRIIQKYWNGSAWQNDGSSNSTCSSGNWHLSYFFNNVSFSTTTSGYYINEYHSSTTIQAYASFYWDADTQRAYDVLSQSTEQYNGTRVTEWITPVPYETVGATTTTYAMHFKYLFTEADYDLSDNATNKLTWTLTPPIFSTESVQNGTFEVPYYSTELNAGGTLSLTATGTYNLSVSLYTEIDTDDWWNPFDNGDIEIVQKNMGDPKKNISIYVVTPTSQAEYDAWHLEQDERYNTDPYGFGDLVQESFERIKMAKPQGYIFLLYDIISATTSTTTPLSLTLTGATDTPLYGHTITLNASSASAFAITTLNQNGMWDKFMSLWNLVWYTLLALFILREVLGGFNIERETVEEKPQNYQKTGGVRGIKQTRKAYRDHSKDVWMGGGPRKRPINYGGRGNIKIKRG